MFKNEAPIRAELHLCQRREIDIDRLCEDATTLALLGSHDGWRIVEAEQAIEVAADALEESGSNSHME